MSTGLLIEGAHSLGIVPALWLLGTRPWDRTSWWLAAVFGVSFLVDTAAHWVPADAASAVYPLFQVALVSLVTLNRQMALSMSAVMAVLAVVAVAVQGAAGFDLFLRTVAWGLIVTLVWPLRGWVRWSFLVTFGVGWLAWLGYAARPSWATWGSYQVTRLVGVWLFCLAHRRHG